MARNRKALRYGLVVLPFVLAVAAAGGGLAARSGASASKASVTEREYRITAPKTLKAGATRFVVTNRGKLTHAFDLSGPGIAKRGTGAIAPGASKTLSVTLKSGTYRLWCPVPGHAALGMKTTIRVAGASSGGGTSTGGTSTGGSSWA